jgi:hypothetical protein
VAKVAQKGRLRCFPTGREQRRLPQLRHSRSQIHGEKAPLTCSELHAAQLRLAFTRFSVYRGEKEIAHFRCWKPLFSQLTDIGIVTGKRRAAMSKIKHQ